MHDNNPLTLYHTILTLIEPEEEGFLYARQRRDILWDHPCCPGGRRPFLCPEHISKTILAMVMKFVGG